MAQRSKSRLKSRRSPSRPPREQLVRALRESEAWFDALNVGLVLCALDGRVFWKNLGARLVAGWDQLPPDLLRRGPGPAETDTESVHWWCCPVWSESEQIGWALWFYREPAPDALEVATLEEAGASARDIDAYLAKVAGDKSAVAGPRANMSARTLEGHLQDLYRRWNVHRLEELKALMRKRHLGTGRKLPR